MTCKKCTPLPHDHLDHAYKSYMSDDDDGNDIITHVYSCLICPCETRMENGTFEQFKGMVIVETGVQM